LMNSENWRIGLSYGRVKVAGLAKKRRIVILLKKPLIKEDNDAFESRSGSGIWS
jgi:hypothetical protein